jgi:UDP-2,3-diacylglucosamine pyrophosphatase LpxH
MIARHFKGEEEISFAISNSSDYRYKVYNTRFRITHGDQFKGGSGISGMLSPLMLGDHRKREKSTGTPYDYLVMGHWHQQAHVMGIIVNGNLKGYDEWT